MNKYYHFTSINNINSIKESGLKPRNGNRCDSIGDGTNAVFLSKGMNGAIITYALMLSYYQKYISNIGDMELANIKDEIDIARTNFEKSIKKAEYETVKNRLEFIRSFSSFEDYLGGERCYLSINEITPDNGNDISNCHYYNKISASNINLVYLINIYNGSTIISQEAVLAYFMSSTLNDKNIYFSQNTINIINNLCNAMCNPYYLQFNKYNYKLEEIPIKDCIYNNSRVLKK